MPNYRRQAEQRLMLLARRFERDEAFPAKYVTFMNKVISNLAKKNNGVCFLPHHGVLHP